VSCITGEGLLRVSLTRGTLYDLTTLRFTTRCSDVSRSKERSTYELPCDTIHPWNIFPTIMLPPIYLALGLSSLLPASAHIAPFVKGMFCENVSPRPDLVSTTHIKHRALTTLL
jgi:hypothetical protein